MLNHKAFLGYAPHALSGDSYVQARFVMDYNFNNKHHVFAKADFARIGDAIFTNKAWLPPPDFSGYALGYGLDSFLGPLEFTWSYSPEVKRRRIYVNIGWWF